MAARTYKKYMKKQSKKDYFLFKLFVISFFGMLIVFTFIINSFSPSVDTSIGDYKQEEIDFDNYEDIKKVVDNRLTMIQEEDNSQDFSSIMQKNEDNNKNEDNKIELKSLTNSKENITTNKIEETNNSSEVVKPDSIYKVFIGTYSSAEQAKVAKDIIIESGSNLNPIIKCLGINNYTLQVGIFKNKASADALLQIIQQNYLPGRIVQDY